MREETLLEIEKTLSDFGCFYCYVNPERDRPNPDSYGSCFVPEKVTKELINKFTKDQWQHAVLYWWGNPNCYLQWKVAAMVIAKEAGVETCLDGVEMNQWGY